MIDAASGVTRCHLIVAETDSKQALPVSCCAVSGSIAAGCGANVRVWDTVTFVLSADYSVIPAAANGGVSCLSFSADGSRLAVGTAIHHIYVWQLATDNLICVIESRAGCISSVDFSPDGNELVSGSDDGSCSVWTLPHTF